MTATSYLGKPTSRVDGRAKVTGTAKYAAEYNVAGVAHGVVVSSAIAKGRIKRIDAADALAVEGVLDVFTHEHRPALASSDEKYKDEVAPPGSPFRPLYDDEFSSAVSRWRWSSRRNSRSRGLRLRSYASSMSKRRMSPTSKRNASTPRSRSRTAPDSTRAAIPRRRSSRRPCGSKPNIACRSSTTIRWRHSQRRRSGKATTRSPSSTRRRDRRTAGTTSPTCWGCRATRCACCRLMSAAHSDPGLRPQYQLPLAALAARALKRSVRVTLTRQQMFTLGYRAANVQTLGARGRQRRPTRLVPARRRGHDLAIRGIPAGLRQLVEPASIAAQTASSAKGSSSSTRTRPATCAAPGGAEGAYAIECAMDELAYAANIDPLELRLINYSDKDQIEDQPYSSKQLRECYRQGAEKFGWSKRNPQPRLDEGRQRAGRLGHGDRHLGSDADQGERQGGADRQWQRRDRKRDRRYRTGHLYDDGPARRRDARRAA